MSNLAHIAQHVFNVPLMIYPGKLHAIMTFLGPRLGLAGEFPILIQGNDWREAAREPKPDPPNVAVINIFGTLVQRGLYREGGSGLVSYENIRARFDAAEADPSVRAIALRIDSGGGTVAGAFSLANHIYRSRGDKPIWAIADESQFSAAYLLASAADRIIVPRTGMAGSIGVIAQHVDQSAWDKMEGVKITPIFAGPRKNDGSPHQPPSKEWLAKMHKVVENVYTQFIDVVARNREGVKGMDSASIRDQESDIFEAMESKDRGLADDMMSVDEALEALAKEVASPSFMGTVARMPVNQAHQGAATVAADREEDVSMSGSQNGSTAAPEQPSGGDHGAQVVDLNKARGEWQANAAAIRTACDKAGVPEIAGALIAEGVTLEQAQPRIDCAAQIIEIGAAMEDPRLGNVAGAKAKARELALAGKSVREAGEALRQMRDAGSAGEIFNGHSGIPGTGGDTAGSWKRAFATAQGKAAA